ncbi:MAG TPA: hypothetical protein VEC99_08740 [Clostridia bacterium]|nr:hypothetical protein [Clostridia bacterium]
MKYSLAHTGNPSRILSLCVAVALFGVASLGRAAVPTPAKLLPDDTLLMVTAPDFAKAQEISKKLPHTQLWNDPAMKPFREKFMAKWNEELVKPLERELDIKLSNYTDLLQGQLTFAVTQNGWQGGDGDDFGILLLLDSKDKSDALKNNLADLRKKWVNAGKTLKSEKIRDVEFTILPISTNDVPKTLRSLIPQSPEAEEEDGDEKDSDEKSAASDNSELVIGQVESLLIIGNSPKAVEKVVSRMTGGTVPPLADLAAYQANHLALFRESPAYGWVNAKAFIDVLTKEFAEKKEDSEAPSPFDFKPEKIMAAIGLSGLKTAAFAFQNANEGSTVQFFLGVPEGDRQGVFKILAGEAKESNPPPFVPANVVKFQRWRMDGQKTWATVQKMLNDISPQFGGGVNFLLDTANAAAREKDPGFDIKKNLIGNLGDDMISYEKAPRGNALTNLLSPPSLFLLGSPNSDQLAAALKSILVYMSQQAGTPPEEREFLGRKVYTIPLQAMAMPFGGTPAANAPRTLSYAASGGYVAFSTDVAMVEEYLRSADSQAKSLRETPGLAEAAQKVTGPGCSLFGYENQLETTRAIFETLKKDAGAASNSTVAAASTMLPGALGAAKTGKDIAEWLDFSLLPPFDQISKYFHFSVYGGSATVDGLTFKVFTPVPPALRGK